ncbi:MAG: cysteine--tRNA ligase, partial [Alphaproteobacteria bacterium]|nr:cysteine--tRNA ligase [Alphaproteobacteria bacterium]
MKIYNSLSHQNEEFNTIEEGKVRMYACGITVSGDAHVGHAYQSIVFDMISKYLTFRGYDVKYVRNYTDVDDKIIAKAHLLNDEPLHYAEYIMAKTDKELAALGSAKPTVQARATQFIPNMIAFIQKLIDKGFAYATPEGNVYYKVAKFPEYGKLSRINWSENWDGVRKEVEPGKLDDKDFALWKAAKPGEISWDTPWGKGRPGWHIECSTMAMQFLGESIDIHGGGRDLVFPHHENEIAQSEALTGKPFAHYWMHNGLLKVNGQKMSKSLNNSIFLSDLLEEYVSDTIRFALLRTLYRSDINITDDLFPEAEKHIYRFYNILNKINLLPERATSADQTAAYITKMEQEFIEAMDDDFNTSEVFAKLFGWMDFMSQELIKKNSPYGLKQIADHLKHLCTVFGILQKAPEDVISFIKNKYLKKFEMTESEIQSQIEQRKAYKQNKQFDLADAIRAQLAQKHILLQDTPQGTLWDIEL